MKYPGLNGARKREELRVGKYYMTRFPDVPDSVFIENESRSGMEVPTAIVEMLIRNFWEANHEDVE